MHVRILTLQGQDQAARRQRLAEAQAWMEGRGWQLGDFNPELGSALFERPEGAPPLRWFDTTRWLPGPHWFRPAQWAAPLLARPRRILFAAAVAAAVTAGFVGVLSSTAVPTSSQRSGSMVAGAEVWLYVQADALNVREAPRDEAQIVGVLYRNQKVLVAGKQGPWARLQVPERGFAAARFLAEHPTAE